MNIFKSILKNIIKYALSEELSLIEQRLHKLEDQNNTHKTNTDSISKAIKGIYDLIVQIISIHTR